MCIARNSSPARRTSVARGGEAGEREREREREREPDLYRLGKALGFKWEAI